MSKEKPSKSAEGKLIYQSPKLISLGEPDTGFGQCTPGSIHRGGCTVGGIPTGRPTRRK
jgi:hypothetical protein